MSVWDSVNGIVGVLGLAAALAALVYEVRRHRPKGGRTQVSLVPRARGAEGMIVQDVEVNLFNGLDAEVGVHNSWLDIHPRHKGLEPPFAEELPSAVPPQHSVRGRLDGSALRTMQSIVQPNSTRLIIRVWVALGNGTRAKSPWIEVPPPRQSYVGGNAREAGSDW